MSCLFHVQRTIGLTNQLTFGRSFVVVDFLLQPLRSSVRHRAFFYFVIVVVVVVIVIVVDFIFRPGFLRPRVSLFFLENFC